MTLSRREFLQIFGVGLGAMSVSAWQSAPLSGQVLPSTLPTPLYGRTLHTSALYTTPHGAPQQALWADSIVRLQGQMGDFYHTGGGWLPKKDVQPLLPTPSPADAPRVGAWAWLAAPLSALRAYCDSRAPIEARIGHGGVLYVLDALQTDEGTRWLQLGTDAQTPLGWGQADHWQALNTPPATPTHEQRHLVLTRSRAQLTAYEQNIAVASLDVALPSTLHAGHYPLSRGALSGSVQAGAHTYHGAPHHLHTDAAQNMTLHGAYWHNTFATHTSAQTLMLNVVGAAWLYQWVGQTVMLEVI